MSLISKIPSFLKSKYLIVLIVFFIWMIFFDPKDWRLIYAKNEKLKELQKSEQTLNKQIAETQLELSMLKGDAQSIEQYAREKYMMKKDNEEVFIVKTR